MQKKRKPNRPLPPRPGTDLVLLAGFPRDSLRQIQTSLETDENLRPARYFGVPAPVGDWDPLYPTQSVSFLARRLSEFVFRYGTAGSMPIPRRILLLYVPSRDDEALLQALDFICYPVKLLAPTTAEDYSIYRTPIWWRHDKLFATSIVTHAIRTAEPEINAVKAEITDKRMSPLALPARNFYFPKGDTAISEIYRVFSREKPGLDAVCRSLLPSRFTRDELNPKAFRGGHYEDHFFQDCRGRVFPLDLHHARSRVPEAAEKESEDKLGKVMAALRQRYRFGVTTRENLHYDVQYPTPKMLVNEEMQCCFKGDVVVNGSHANTGVNDSIWIPDGTIVPKKS